MTFFTDSPFERMMVQKPKYGREVQPPAPPKDHRCFITALAAPEPVTGTSSSRRKLASWNDNVSLCWLSMNGKMLINRLISSEDKR
jgi:hypothetical protein